MPQKYTVSRNKSIKSIFFEIIFEKYLKRAFTFLPTFVAMKLLTDTDYIHALIAEGEHQQQDFKFEISDARKIAKTLSTLPTRTEDDYLLALKTMVKSQEYAPKKKKYMIEAAAQLYCVPEVEYSLQTYIVEGRQVLVATIEETPHKPVYAKDETGKP